MYAKFFFFSFGSGKQKQMKVIIFRQRKPNKSWQTLLNIVRANMAEQLAFYMGCHSHAITVTVTMVEVFLSNPSINLHKI